MARPVDSLSVLFDPEPFQWGLRGDPFLWRDIARALGSRQFPDTDRQLEALIEAEFERLTGTRLPGEGNVSALDFISVQRYAQGGMSSGRVSPHFWRVTALPLLRSRFVVAHDQANEAL